MYGSTTKIVHIMTLSNLDPFYAKVKFGHLGFCLGKVKINLFFFFLETITALGLKVFWSIQLNV